MKKRTFYAITASVIFSTTIISCGSESTKTSSKETTTEKVTEEPIEEAATSASGEELFTSNGCVTCHQVETKTIGPALTAINEFYGDDKDGLIAFLNGEGDAIVDPEQAAIMAPQVETTKAMSTEERNAIADYMLSH